MAKRGRLKLGDNIYRYYKTIFNHCDVFSQQSNRIRWKKANRLLRRLRSFKVIDVGTNRKPVCDLLLVINSNWQPVWYFSELSQLIFWTLCVFEPPLGGLGTMYDVRLRLIGKLVVDLVIIELFSLDVSASWSATGENRSKIGDFAPTRPVWPKVSMSMSMLYTLLNIKFSDNSQV